MNTTLYTVRIDKQTDRLVSRFAAAHDMSRSEVVREALRRFIQETGGGRADSVYEAIADLIGSHRSSQDDLSERTGARFRQLLNARRTGKRPPRAIKR